MRIVTLLPAATEIVAALAPESLVGVSHECDYPAWITKLPRVTRTSVDVGASSKEIDAQVRRLTADGKPVIWVDAQVLEALKPDLIITQGLCEVCAVADGEVYRASERLSTVPRVHSLAGKTLAGIFEDIRGVARAIGAGTGADGAGMADEAEELIAGMQYKLSKLRRERPLGCHPERSEGSTVPRAVVVEWLDPLFLAGHWVPELIEAAGGHDFGAQPGDHSHPRPWTDLLELKPDVIVVALCGFSVERAKQEWASQLPEEAKAVLTALPPYRLTVIDGNAYTSRPGPRVVEAFVSVDGRTRVP